MSPLLASAVLGLLDSIIGMGMGFIVTWAMWTDQLRGRTKIAAVVVGMLAGVAVTLRLCGVRP